MVVVVVVRVVVVGRVVVGRVVAAGGTVVCTTVDRSTVGLLGAVVCSMADGALVVVTVRRVAVALSVTVVAGAWDEDDVVGAPTEEEVGVAVVVANGTDDPAVSADDPSAAGTTDCDRAGCEESCDVVTDGAGSSPLVRAAAVTTVPAAHTATSAASAPPRCRALLTLVIRLE
ncbi:MAG: hypothetical protein QME72_11195, partial [Rhodococcus sp. (in: high G+C Gram-positive bacteria)]